MHRFDPLDYSLAFEEPLRLTNSTWTEHVPFALALVQILRPSLFVELGTYRGVSYAAFCQAITRLSLPATAFAVDTWQGDSQSGMYEEDVYEEWARFHGLYFGRFSHLLRMPFDEAVSSFADGSIDLLHIDGYHTYEAVRHDFAVWQGKVSNRGVVLFHDITVRRPTFGVWRFWEEVRSQHRTFEFHHGNGLGVLALGREVPAELEALLTASADEKAMVRTFYSQLGERLQARFMQDVYGAETRKLHEAWKNNQAEIRRLHEAWLSGQTEVERLRAAHAAAAAEVERLSQISLWDEAIARTGRRCSRLVQGFRTFWRRGSGQESTAPGKKGSHACGPW